jgi:acetyl-CoA carboxylase alpha subunit
LDQAGENNKAFEKISDILKKSLVKHLKALLAMPTEQRGIVRYEKFRKMGEWV